MERFLNDSCDPKQLSPLTLAFLGDAVFELFVRERLVCQGSRPTTELHRMSVQEVCCTAQSKMAKLLCPLLTDEEAAVFRRGKNAHPGHVPKNASQSDYHLATALETLFGYLYLCGRLGRLREFFEMIQHQRSNSTGFRKQSNF